VRYLLEFFQIAFEIYAEQDKVTLEGKHTN
jgi:hypothetical protein